ncbi:MAG TPA: hypothetical protein VIG88_04865 [Lysobacter sp.]
MKPLLVIGASSFGKLVHAIAEDCGRVVAGYIDDVNAGPGILGGRADLLSRFSPAEYEVVMAIGYSHMTARLAIFEEVSAAGFAFPALVHPRALVNPRSDIGTGCIVMAGANVDAFTTIEPLCVLWPSATVSHDSVIGRNTFVSPGATLCGFVRVGASSFIGAGSVIINGSHMPEHGFVKAGTRFHQPASEAR